MTGDPIEFFGLPAGSKVRRLYVDGVPMCPPLVNCDNFVARHDADALPVLGLDLGTSMGWALRTSACISSGTKDWTQRTRETRGERLLRFSRWLMEIQRATPLSLVAYELVQHMGEQQRLAAHCYAQFQAVLLLFAARCKIPVREVHTATLKKAITGRGNHPKGTSKVVMGEAIRELGFAPTSFDEADALGVLHWATKLRGKS